MSDSKGDATAALGAVLKLPMPQRPRRVNSSQSLNRLFTEEAVTESPQSKKAKRGRSCLVDVPSTSSAPPVLSSCGPRVARVDSSQHLNKVFEVGKSEGIDENETGSFKKLRGSRLNPNAASSSSSLCVLDAR